MTVEALFVTIAILPGYVGLLTLRFLSADEDGATWETIARSLVIGFLSALPVLLLGVLQGYEDFLFGRGELTIDVLWGIVAHTALAVALSFGLARVLTSRRVSRLGRSLFHSAWDWTWFHTAKERRYILVQTENGTFYGSLAFAGTQRKGGGLVVKNPMALTNDGKLKATGTEFLLLNEDQIRYIQISPSNRST